MEDYQNLNRNINLEEIRVVVFSISPRKALGLDDFPTRCYQKTWHTLGSKVCDMVHNIWMNPSEIMNFNQRDI